MTPELKAALARLAQIEDQDDGYSTAVMVVYGQLPKRQLFRDAALVREYLKTLED